MEKALGRNPSNLGSYPRHSTKSKINQWKWKLKSIKEIFQEQMLMEMSNLRYKTTGLPVIIFVSSGYTEGKMLQHSPRIKVSKTYSEKMNPFDTFSVTISKNPEVIGDHQIKSKDLNKIKEFVKENYDVLIEYWEGEIETLDMLHSIQKINWIYIAEYR